MTSSVVCVDASLVLMLLLSDERRVQAQTLFSRWDEDNVVLVSPPLLYAEVPSVLRAAVYFGRISHEEGERAFQAFCDFDITVISRENLHILAWELAKEHLRSRAYDSMYLAVARSEGCDFWTGDLRLANSVNAPWVRWAGTHQG